MSREAKMSHEARLNQAIRILESNRTSTIQQLRAQARWLRSSMEGAFEYAADSNMWKHVDCEPIVSHGARLGSHMARLQEQNLSMLALQDLAKEAGFAWPADVIVVELVKDL